MKPRSALLFVPLALALPGLSGAAAAPAAPAAAASGQAISPAESALRVLNDRLQKILADAEKAGDKLDEENFRLKMQQLAFDYDDFLKKNSAYAPGFTAYGMMLVRIDMRKEAAAMFSKADTLFEKTAKDPAVRTAAYNKAWALSRNQLGNYMAEEGRPLEAVAMFIGAIDLVPSEPLYHYQLGRLLAAARDDFLTSGAWTREGLEKSMHDAFKRATELAPDRFEFSYRYAESFYDLEHPDWDTALKLWNALEAKAETDVERQTLRLHAANVLIRQGKPDAARTLLATITETALDPEKQKLVAQLPPAAAK